MTAIYFLEASTLLDLVLTLDFVRFFCFLVGDYFEFSKLGIAMKRFPAKL